MRVFMQTIYSDKIKMKRYDLNFRKCPKIHVSHIVLGLIFDAIAKQRRKVKKLKSFEF